jgi:hypothetical protein
VVSARRLEWPAWVGRADAWSRRLGSELVMLPDTLKHLREAVENFRRATQPETLDQLQEGVENFRRVTQRLVDATAGMEQLSAMQSGFSEMRQRVEEANRAFREQVAGAPGGDRVAGALQDLNDTLARWNPFLPRPPRRDST